MELNEFVQRKAKQWEAWSPHPSFELLALGILRDLETRIHTELSNPRTPQQSENQSPQSSSLRLWLFRRPLPKQLQEALSAERAAGNPRSSRPAQAVSYPDLPAVLSIGHLLTTDRPWEERMIETGAGLGAFLLTFDIELELQGLGLFESSSRDWALDRGWVPLLAEASPQHSSDPSRHFRARWHWIGIPDTPEPPWDEISRLPGALRKTGTIRKVSRRTPGAPA